MHYFEKLFSGNRDIQQFSPEWRFMYLLSIGEPEEAVGLFGSRRIYGIGPMCVDTPYGLFEGIDEILSMARGWFDVMHAVRMRAVPVTQTRAGSRSATEMVIYYEKEDGSEDAFPMAAVADLCRDESGRDGFGMDALRIYYDCEAIPGTTKYRPPCFPLTDESSTRQEMLSGVIRDYFRLLHGSSKEEFIEKSGEIFGDMMSFGCYYIGPPMGDFLLKIKREDFVPGFAEHMFPVLGGQVNLRMETIIDDGKICCVEWEQMVLPGGRTEEAYCLSEAGISFYERDETGRICSARIIDYANREREIDWSTARKTKEEAENIYYLRQI